MALEQSIVELIDNKSSEMNSSSRYCINEVSTITKQLNAYISGNINLTTERIIHLLKNLVRIYTITLDLPISDVKLLRATKFDKLNVKPCFDDVSRLSYIPKSSSVIPSLGRLNKVGQSMYYGCIYFNDKWGGVNVAFSEVNVLKNEKINILKSISTEDLIVRYIGIYDYVKSNNKPDFLSDDVFDTYKRVYDYQQVKYKPELFCAFQLCDAFFADVLQRQGSERLYHVTSQLSDIFLGGEQIDGIIYTSVKVKDSPVIALKPPSIDAKVDDIEAVCFDIKEDYGYSLYKADILYNGVVSGDSVNWS